MRLKLQLKATPGDAISINYYYPLASSLYSLLRFGSPEFADFIHDQGFRAAGKTYKLFCFSLSFYKTKFFNGLLNFEDPRCTLLFSSPLNDEFFKVFLKGSFEKEIIKIMSPYHTSVLKIDDVQLLTKPDIHSEMKFSLLSPMVLSKKVITPSGNETQYYLRPDDIEDINRVLNGNLRNKYEALTGKSAVDKSIEFEWDKQYLASRERVTKKIRLDEYSDRPIDVIGTLAPFTIKGSRELIKIGYEAGFGEKNSMGFGMADVRRR